MEIDSLHNHLSNETSPYLLQHRNNPVDWYPWGNEAFGKALAQDKPILLSIGYSTCHWCHVMAHESFEDREIANILNEGFVSIKVDREERPDVDQIYMTVTQSRTGHGGWPNTVFLTPDLKPFFAGTYFPKSDLSDLLRQIIMGWKTNRIQFQAQGELLVSDLKQFYSRHESEPLNADSFKKGIVHLVNSFDKPNAGFGYAPKFPAPENLVALFRSGDLEAQNCAIRTLLAMRNGGIYDQLGYGLHRYSTDAKWRIPHFEKMLYDQAMLILALCEAQIYAPSPPWKEIVREIILYVTTELYDPDCGFFSGQDADSDGEEGKFYMWNREEISEALGSELSPIAFQMYDVATGKEKSVLINAMPDETANIERVEIRQKLLKIRSLRAKPTTDDTVLTDWNGLMIAALARASNIFEEPGYGQIAVSVSRKIIEHSFEKSGKLLHSFRDGNAKIEGCLDDYAFLLFGLVEVYQSQFSLDILKSTIQLAEKMVELFIDKERGGFFLAENGPDLIVRPKSAEDGAIPSGNGIASQSLGQLGLLIGRSEFADLAKSTIEAFATSVNFYPELFFSLLLAGETLRTDDSQLVIVATNEELGREASCQIRKVGPNCNMLLKTLSNSIELEQIAPYTSEMKQLEGETTFYVCRNQTCRLPTADLNEALSQIAFKSHSSKMTK